MSHEALVVASSRSYDADHPRAVTAPERARDLMEMVISHNEIDAMRLSRCLQGIPGGRMPRRFAMVPRTRAAAPRPRDGGRGRLGSLCEFARSP